MSVGQGRKLFKYGEPWEKEMVTSHGRMLHFFRFHVFAKTIGKFYIAFGDYFMEG